MFKNYFLSISKRKFLILSFLIPLVYTLLLSFFCVEKMHKTTNFRLPYLFFRNVFFVPIIETFLFQFSIIEMMLKLKINFKMIISISGLIFGLLHYTNTYNLFYALLAVVVGFIFASIYLFSKIRKDVNAFCMVFLVHLLINLVAFLYNDFLKFS